MSTRTWPTDRKRRSRGSVPKRSPVSAPKSSPSASAGAAPASSARLWLPLIRQVASDPVNRVVFVTALVVVGFGDSVLLPYDYTQRISLGNWQYFGARYLAFTIGFALAMAWVLTLQIHSLRRLLSRSSESRVAQRGGLLGTLAAVVSLLPSFLCCSPIVPTLVSLLSLSATTQLRTTGRIQYFFATKQDLLLVGSLCLVVASALWSMRKLSRAVCVGDSCVAEEDCCSESGSGAQPRSRPRPVATGAALGDLSGPGNAP
jgi:hypothetical protein